MHFYWDNGEKIETMHFVPMVSKPGFTRPTRMSDVYKWWTKGMDVQPSVNTVMNVLDKGALTNWKIEQHISAAHSLFLGKYDDDIPDLDEFIQDVKEEAEMHMALAPAMGTVFHDRMENFINGTESDELCEDVLDVMIQNIDPTDFGAWSMSTEVNFVSPMGYGGQADLIIDTGKETWLIDYKTKATADKFKPGRMVYDDHRIQLAAYRKALCPKAKTANVFVCLETGEVDFHAHKASDINKAYRIFEYALRIWNLKHRK